MHLSKQDDTTRIDSLPNLLQGVFAAARALAPSVVFIDELDSLTPARSGGGMQGGESGTALSGDAGPGSDASVRIVATLLKEMDGKDPICLICSFPFDF